MVRRGYDDNLRVKRVERAAAGLNTQIPDLVATPPTLACLGLLPRFLKRLTDIHNDRSGHEYLFVDATMINRNHNSVRQRAVEAVQNLLVEVHNKLNSLDFTGIQQCAIVLREFESFTTLLPQELQDSEGFRALGPQIHHVKALFVEKATAILQDVVARASTNEQRTPWPVLLLEFGDFDDLLSINPALFESAQGIQSLLDRVKTVFCPPQAEAITRQDVQRVHVNQVVWDLYNNPAAPYLATTDSSAFGGVCSNIFRSAQRPTHKRTWVNAPLPRTPHKREIALNWITTYLHEQQSLLRAQCQVDLRPQESADGFSKSITLHSLSDDQYFQEKESVIHFVHLDRLKTYHLTTYRKHIVHLPFEMVVLGCNTNKAKSPLCEKVGNMSLILMGPGGVKTNGLSNQYILTREFDGDAEYSVIATSITADEDEVKCPHLDGHKREWTSWMIITKVDECMTSVVQMSVATGLQFSNGDFVPYDNVVREEDYADSLATFDAMTCHLKTYYTVAFEKDAVRCIDDLKQVMRYQLVDQAPAVATDRDDEVLAENTLDDETIAWLMQPAPCSEENEATSETVNNDTATDALETDIAPTSVAATNDVMADHRSLNSSGAPARPIHGQNPKRKREDKAEADDDETKRVTQELRRALAIVDERRTSLFRSFHPSLKAPYHFVEHLRTNPIDLIVFLRHAKYEDADTVREWVEKLLRDMFSKGRRWGGE